MALFGKSEGREGREVRDRSDGGPPAPATAASQRTPAPGPVDREHNEETSMANIGKSITISGDLTGEEDLVIEGKVEGKVSLPNNQLTVGQNGAVQAEVNAKSVVVIGRVAGNVRGTERVEIQATGIVDGDVVSPKLVVAEGAVLNGSISMTGKSGASAGASPAPTPPPQADVRKAG